MSLLHPMVPYAWLLPVDFKSSWGLGGPCLDFVIPASSYCLALLSDVCAAGLDCDL